jgi:hypothetical protein
VLGTYLFVHFAQLLPWGTELFSRRGVIPSATQSPLAFFFPNVLATWDGPIAVSILLLGSIVASAAFALDVHARAAAFGLWYVSACLLGRNPLIANPAMPYVGWMLLAFACSAPDRGAKGDTKGSSWPREIQAVAWFLLALGYSYSGIAKLSSPSWLDGTALRHVLENPLARPGHLREALLALPTPCLAFMTWSVLALEAAFAPLALFRRLRPALWLLTFAMHLALLAIVNFADLSLGMLIFQILTFDPSWLATPLVASESRQRRFGQVTT